MQQKHCLIIGGGIAGLTAAIYLHHAGVSFTLIEQSNHIGGRIASDYADGFIFDHGFQVFLTAYPEAKQLLDYPALDLRPFYPGADIVTSAGVVRIADPARHPIDSLSALFAKIGSLKDKINVPLLRSEVKKSTLESIFSKSDFSTLTALQEQGFSETMINTVFKPFLGGIFLESALETSHKMFNFVFKMFYEGDTCVPAHGMNAIPKQLLSKLPQDCIQLNKTVKKVNNTSIELEDGSELHGSHIIVATDAHRLPNLFPELNVPQPKQWNSTITLYFSTSAPPITEPILILNATGGSSLINSVAIMSNVSNLYAPAGKSLLSVSIIGIPELSPDALISAVINELQQWFPYPLADLTFLREYRIPYALPAMFSSVTLPTTPTALSDSILLAGDHLTISSINGAMASGRVAAQAVIQA